MWFYTKMVNNNFNIFLNSLCIVYKSLNKMFLRSTPQIMWNHATLRHKVFRWVIITVSLRFNQWKHLRGLRGISTPLVKNHYTFSETQIVLSFRFAQTFSVFLLIIIFCVILCAYMMINSGSGSNGTWCGLNYKAPFVIIFFLVLFMWN